MSSGTMRCSPHIGLRKFPPPATTELSVAIPASRLTLLWRGGGGVICFVAATGGYSMLTFVIVILVFVVLEVLYEFNNPTEYDYICTNCGSDMKSFIPPRSRRK